ncbi:related to ankyrin [Phialocephala subalpina]|uniref:Related to ankyrin n=1 Tax=Phialocephala subalpina TaxID=576137 RepID=A0A1L7XP44_9HELO|nr:related to ankyrin [Phialocephala subalpina]
MRIFARNHERDPAQKARSSVLRRLLGKKGGQARPEAGSVASSVSGNSLGREEHSGDDSVNPVLNSRPLTNYEGSPTTQTLWDRAYDTLREGNRQLVEKYEKLLSKELLETNSESNNELLQTETTLDDSKNVIDNTNRQTRQAQLAAVTKRGLERMDGNRIEYHIFGRAFVLKDQIAQAVGLVQWAKDWIGAAVKASPEASIAWAGVCVVLPLLTNPSAADAAYRDGFACVTNRMRYYIALEPLLLELIQDPSIAKTTDNLTEECKAHIVDLYQYILDFQFRSVLRFYRNWLGNLGRDLVQGEDWKQMQLKIKDLEDIVYKDFIQINELLSRQKLDCLNEKTKESLQNLYQILSTAKEQLRATEDIRDLASDHIKLTQTLAERRQQNQEELDKQACHQVFRITKGEKDNSYEWYKNRVEDRVGGTCEWFLTHENFLSWLKQDAGPLLVSADPGCGKSVLAKYLIDYGLPRAATICYFFFKDQDQNTLSQALCALLHQLFSQKPDLIRHAMPEYFKNGSGIVTLATTLWNILKDAAQDPAARPTIFVLDALDECAETDFRGLIRMLMAFFLQEPSKLGRVKFLLTSRPYENVVSGFHGLVDAFPYIRIPGEDESEAIGQEVNNVIRHRVQQLRLSADIGGHLERRLIEIPHRTYLWVYLVFDYLATSGFKRTKKGIESIIATLPESVNQAYEKILEKHKDSQMVRKALSIILAASRPLTLTEMNVAINTDISSRSMEDLDLEREDDFKRRLRSWCGLFVSIYHGKVYFLHQTAREFLLANLSSSGNFLPASGWHHSIHIHQAHAILADVCVVYLNFLNSDLTLTDTNGKSGHYNNNYAFLDYSAKNWGTHFRLAYISNNADIVPFTLRICNSDSKSYSAWFKIYWKTKNVKLPGHFPDLMVASYFGHKAVVKLLLEKSAKLETKDNYGRTPLSWAAGNGHEAVVELLLEKSAELETKDNCSRTPLLWAAQCGYEAVIELLLEKGAELKTKDNYGRTPLSWAAGNGHKAVVELLLEKGAELETKNNYSRTPLSWAAQCGYEAVIELLLEKGAELETKDKDYGQTPLSWAARCGYEAVVELLLDKGAELETKDNYSQTPLSWAAENGHEVVVELLLEKGAELETKSNNGQTPLSWAAENGHEAVVELLLEKSAFLETKDNCNRTPLSWAIENGHEAVVELLLEKGAELGIRNDYN